MTNKQRKKYQRRQDEQGIENDNYIDQNGRDKGDDDDDDDGNDSAEKIIGEVGGNKEKMTAHKNKDENDDNDDNESEYEEENDEIYGDYNDGNDNLEGEKEEEPNSSGNSNDPVKRRVYKLSMTKTEDFNAKLRKRGVVYMSRIPPKMTPTKVKSLLSEFGEVTRVYLVEEDATVRKRRRKLNGNSGGKRYLEGWIEFAKKRVAKHVAQSLNTTPISNYKRSAHYGDLWNLKYLNKFKWSHLTEKVAYERRVREQKLRVEMMQARRENAAYVELVETGKKLDKIEERKRKRGESLSSKQHQQQQTSKRRLKQKEPLQEGTDKPTKSALLNSLV